MLGSLNIMAEVKDEKDSKAFGLELGGF